MPPPTELEPSQAAASAEVELALEAVLPQAEASEPLELHHMVSQELTEFQVPTSPHQLRAEFQEA